MEHVITVKTPISDSVQAAIFRHLLGERNSFSPSINISRVDMIKLVREGTGCGLKEAKDYIDQVFEHLVERMAAV